MKIAAVQARPVWLDRAATVKKIVALMADAAARGAELVVFSETFLCGYPFWACRTNGAAFNDPMQKHAYALYLEAAVSATGPELRVVREAAGDLGLFVFLGVSERDPGGASGSVYCSLAAIDPGRGLIGMHRKLVPTHDERLVWSRGDGHGLRAYEYKGVRIGGLICWENWMPLARHALYADGIDVLVSVWPGWSNLTRDITRFTAIEGRVYSVAASGLLSLDDARSDFPMLDAIRESYPNDVFDGGSGIVAPDGNWVAGPVVGREEVIIAEVDLHRVHEERLMFDVAGHYARPDVFSCRVNRHRQASAVFDDAAVAADAGQG